MTEHRSRRAYWNRARIAVTLTLTLVWLALNATASQAQVSAQCPAWDAGKVYVAKNVVAHGGQNWEAFWWTQGDEPGKTKSPHVWRPSSVADCSGLPNARPNPQPGPNPNPTPKPGTTVVRLSELQADEARLTAGDAMVRVKASIATLDNARVEAVRPGASANPNNVRRVESIVSEAEWAYLFPRRAPEYTYVNFLKAIAKFPAFCGDYADGRDAAAICRRALATMFAHFTQETGGHTSAWPEAQWRQGLYYLRELGWNEDMPNGYGLCDPKIWQGEQWPCSAFPAGHAAQGQFKSYFGRGAKQLSYNYNYGPFSYAIYGDKSVLLKQPNLVADTWLNLASAVFFYVYPQPPKPSMLHALDGTWVPNAHDLRGGLTPGFGVTTQIINGGIECGGSAEHQQSLNRIEYYRQFAARLGVPVASDEVLGCANMQRFDTQGAGALNIYWERDWGQANACKLVNYQTRFSAFTDGDYVRCVEHFFNVTIDRTNPDEDNDGLPDVYETSHRLRGNDSSDALADTDGDGFSNLAEYQAGTSVNDAKAMPRMATGPATLVASVLPGSRSPAVNRLATAFATLMNTGTGTATGCSVVPVAPLPGVYFYQTTNPATNAVTGTANTPVDIPANGMQTFVFGLTPSADLAATDVALRFACTNTGPATVLSGINTFRFSASSTPIPDVVALASTVSNDGIVAIPGASGIAAFSVAAANVGFDDLITVRIDTGNAVLPLQLSLCETDALTATCINPTQPSTSPVTTTIPANATPTFSVFAMASGDIPLDPALNRIFVRFEDASGVTRGLTSVAVRTQ